MARRDSSPTSTSSSLSNITVQTDKKTGVRAMSSASPSISTPPTSLDDRASVLSETTKFEQAIEVDDEAPALHTSDEAHVAAQTTPGTANSEGRRSARNARKSVTTYNVQILSGTAIHTPTKYLEKHHMNVLHGSLESMLKKEKGTPGKKKLPKPTSEAAEVSDPVEEQLVAEAAQAARRRTSSRVTDLRKEALRNLSSAGDAVASAISGGKTFVQRTLRRSMPDSRMNASQLSPVPVSLKRPRTATGAEDKYQNSPLQEKEYLQPKSKVWLKQGLYVGQHRDFDPRLSESQNRVKKRNRNSKENTTLPLPIFACDRLLNEDPRHVFRDFKLPFDTYYPLPRKVKVDGWVKLNKNRFIGDASALWKRDKQDSSQCYCDPEDGCGEACHNRIMAYECDSTNCRLTPERCGNRPFAELRRRAKGNRYDYGVEVVHTEDRGYGVRAMRTFEPNQIIVEYAGEIITQYECERRMKQVYKKDKCYYLMSFDNKMIIDATRGTIARFVNHSCEPNCEMIKWTVGGEPRMALFAGPRGIMTGEELTYDYNFDPFSQKNIQECRCGTESCRGVLGPKPKKPIEEKSVSSILVTGTKRKVQDLYDSSRAGSESTPNSPKKRRVSLGTPITAKAKKAHAETQAARERAEREATEHSRQITSRENRAMKRSTSGTGSRRSRAAFMRTNMSSSVKFTRHTTVSFKRKVPKSSALKAVKKPTSVHSTRPRTTPAHNSQKGRRTLKRPSTPIESSGAEESDSEEDTSPNITPASLRSASAKLNQLSPVNQGRMGRKTSSRAGSEQVRAVRTFTIRGAKLQQRNFSSAPRTIHKTGAGVKKIYHPAQSRSRSARGRFIPKGRR